MELLVKGRALPQGSFSLHSRFQKVMNFKTEGGTLLSLVTPEIGSGPLRLVMKSLPDWEGELRLYLFEESATLVSEKGESLAWNFTKIFDPSFPAISCESVIGSLEKLKALLLEKAPAKSLAFLLDEKREGEFQSSFEKAYKESFKEAFSPLGKTRLSDIIVAFKGKGLGLTPSGDDFNLGILTALKLQGQTLEELLKVARGENPFVNSFLYELEMNWAHEKLQNFLLSFERSEECFLKAVEDFLNQGETSGSDFLVGFYTGFNLGRVYAN